MSLLEGCRRILLVRDDRLGDVVLTTPVLEQVRKNVPAAKITFLTSSYTADVVRGNEYIDDVILYDKKDAHRGIFAGIFGFAAELRKHRFDAVIVFHPTTRMHLVTALAGIPVRIGWDRKSGFLLTDRFPHEKQNGEKHETEYNADLLRLAGLDVGELSLSLPYEAIKRSGDVELARHGVMADERYFVLGLGTSCPSKQWPVTSFAEIARVLRREYPESHLSVLAAGKERHLTEEFAEIYGDSFLDLTGILSVKETIVFLKEHGAAFVGNDSGLGHISAACGVPTVVVFGRNDPGLSPVRWRPLGPLSEYVHRPPECAPCKAHACENEFECIRTVSPGEVWVAVHQVIEKKHIF